jgi:excisionase family DNA binding protein
MPRTKKTPDQARGNGPPPPAAGDVLTLTEAAAYLRVSADNVLRMVREQGLPARQIGEDWRFLRDALQDSLREPSAKKGLLSQIGTLGDDPHLEEMLAEIYRQRGQPEVEEG